MTKLKRSAKMTRLQELLDFDNKNFARYQVCKMEYKRRVCNNTVKDEDTKFIQALEEKFKNQIEEADRLMDDYIDYFAMINNKS